MRWNHQSRLCRAYLLIVFALSIPASIYAFSDSSDYSLEWVFLTVVSIFVATINVRLPKISSVISMGDVFVILSLLNFGPGPALVMYWFDIIIAHLSDTLRKHGLDIRGKILLHRFLFNLSCCALSVYAMEISKNLATSISGPNNALGPILSLAAIAFSWFVVNTTTVSLAISFWMEKPFVSVW